MEKDSSRLVDFECRVWQGHYSVTSDVDGDEAAENPVAPFPEFLILIRAGHTLVLEDEYGEFHDIDEDDDEDGDYVLRTVSQRERCDFLLKGVASPDLDQKLSSVGVPFEIQSHVVERIVDCARSINAVHSRTGDTAATTASDALRMVVSVELIRSRPAGSAAAP